MTTLSLLSGARGEGRGSALAIDVGGSVRRNNGGRDVEGASSCEAETKGRRQVARHRLSCVGASLRFRLREWIILGACVFPGGESGWLLLVVALSVVVFGRETKTLK
jgi:hypothetical protein